MLSLKPKKEAMLIHKNAVEKYNSIVEVSILWTEKLYLSRKESVDLLTDIESFVNSIANNPVELGALLNKIQFERDKFKETEEYSKEAYESSVKTGISFFTSVATGATIASVSPSVAMWVATTFGKASTGRAISTLSGAAAQKAALAWLGGGALSAGGSGVAAGTTLLALAGPIGWGIAGISSVSTITSYGLDNSKQAKQMMKEAEQITISGAIMKESLAIIDNLFNETNLLFSSLEDNFNKLKDLENRNYLEFSQEQKLELGTLVNNSFSLAELLNKVVE